MALAPAGPDRSDLACNAIECLDEDELYNHVEGDRQGCPEDDSHAFQPIHVSETPLGYDDDAEYYHPARRQYEYFAQED